MIILSIWGISFLTKLDFHYRSVWTGTSQIPIIWLDPKVFLLIRLHLKSSSSSVSRFKSPPTVMTVYCFLLEKKYRCGKCLWFLFIQNVWFQSQSFLNFLLGSRRHICHRVWLQHWDRVECRWYWYFFAFIRWWCSLDKRFLDQEYRTEWGFKFGDRGKLQFGLWSWEKYFWRDISFHSWLVRCGS